jgi:hypothetical protein
LITIPQVLKEQLGIEDTVIRVVIHHYYPVRAHQYFESDFHAQNFVGGEAVERLNMGKISGVINEEATAKNVGLLRSQVKTATREALNREHVKRYSLARKERVLAQRAHSRSLSTGITRLFDGLGLAFSELAA